MVKHFMVDNQHTFDCLKNHEFGGAVSYPLEI